MIETMNNFHQLFEADDPSDEGNGQEYHPATQLIDDNALDDINEVFVRELLKREASFNASSSTAQAPISLEPTGIPRQNRKRQACDNFASDMPVKSLRSQAHVQPNSETRFSLQDDVDTTPFFAAFKEAKDDLRSKTRAELEDEVRRFNEELETRKAELGLAESSQRDLASMKKRREKWSSEEMGTLWGAISLHGNNWTAISKIVPGRNYFQVKDKGRRELCGRGWETGRKKSEGSEAMLHAQWIAQMELQAFFKAKEAKKGSFRKTGGAYNPSNGPFKQ